MQARDLGKSLEPSSFSPQVLQSSRDQLSRLIPLVIVRTSKYPDFCLARMVPRISTLSARALTPWARPRPRQPHLPSPW